MNQSTQGGRQTAADLKRMTDATHRDQSANKDSKLTVREEKKNYIKKVVKEKLNMTSIGDLVLCDIAYNYGLFGCNNTVEDVQPMTDQADRNGNQLFAAFNQSITNFNESFNMNMPFADGGSLGFLKGKNQDDDLHYNLLGHCAIKDR